MNRNVMRAAFAYGAVVLIAVLDVLLLSPKWWQPQGLIFDEVFFVNTARLLINRGVFDYLGHFTGHPPHGSMAVAAAIELLGDTPFAWRVVPVAAHAGSVILIALLGTLVTGNKGVGIVGALLFTVDGLSFSQGSTLFFNAQMGFFILASLNILLLPRGSSRSGATLFATFASGASLGIAAGFRWPALYFVPTLLYVVLSDTRYTTREKCEQISILGFGTIVGYLLPMVLLAHWGALESFSLIEFHQQVLRGQSSIVCNHTYRSEWWQWPLLLRPIWYFFEPPVFGQVVPAIRGVVALGNPVIFAVVPVASLALIIESLRGKKPVATIFLVGALSMWLPWSFLRATQYFHYFYPVLPFSFLVVADRGVSVWQQRGWICRAVLLILLAAAMYVFCLFYPLFTAALIPETQWQSLMWLRSWI